MSFLKRLFGSRTAAERVVQGVKLVAQGEPAFAKVEFEAALMTDELDVDERRRVQAQLDAVCDGLARARLDDARNLLASGEERDARAAIELARSLVRDAALRRQIDELAAARAPSRPAAQVESDLLLPKIVARRDDFGSSRSNAGFAGSARARDDEREVDDDVAVVSEAMEGDDDLSSLELALLVFREEEADRFRALIAVDKAVAEALGAQHDGDVAAARAAWARTRQPSSSDPLVVRETARAAIIDGDYSDAISRLEALPTGDDECRELLLEALVGAGRIEPAADLAVALLTERKAQEPVVAISALADAGRLEVAFEWVDRLLDARGDDVRLWELRSRLCEQMDNQEGQHEADERAFELYRTQCGSCSGPPPSFPLASARRHAERVVAAADAAKPTSRAVLDDTLRVMIAADVEQRQRWQTLLGQLQAES